MCVIILYTRIFVCVYVYVVYVCSIKVYRVYIYTTHFSFVFFTPRSVFSFHLIFLFHTIPPIHTKIHTHTHTKRSCPKPIHIIYHLLLYDDNDEDEVTSVIDQREYTLNKGVYVVEKNILLHGQSLSSNPLRISIVFVAQT